MSTVGEQLVHVLRQAGVARVYGGVGDSLNPFVDAIRRWGLEDALKYPGPALVDLVTDPNALSIPPHITGTQMAGFALAATKIVLDGGVGQMLEMARANLRNIPGAELLS
jgi:pyruvate dehydrogenase (quinone)